MVSRLMPPKVSEKFQAIKERNGGELAGFFDVFAWKGEGEEFAFVEYKGRDEAANESELEWINAAITAGVRPEQMCIIGYDLPN